MKPEEKSPEIESFLSSVFGVDRKQSILNNVCVSCGEPAAEFRNALIRHEYAISGLCEQCQDSVFREEE